jgi:hypothetical protein
VAVENKAGNPKWGGAYGGIVLAAFLFGPLESTASSYLPANQTSKSHPIARDMETMANESFTATLQIGPSRHLPAHLQKGLCKSIGMCTLCSRCKVSPLIA